MTKVQPCNVVCDQLTSALDRLGVTVDLQPIASVKWLPGNTTSTLILSSHQTEDEHMRVLADTLTSLILGRQPGGTPKPRRHLRAVALLGVAVAAAAVTQVVNDRGKPFDEMSPLGKAVRQLETWLGGAGAGVTLSHVVAEQVNRAAATTAAPPPAAANAPPLPAALPAAAAISAPTISAAQAAPPVPTATPPSQGAQDRAGPKAVDLDGSGGGGVEQDVGGPAGSGVKLDVGGRDGIQAEVRVPSGKAGVGVKPKKGGLPKVEADVDLPALPKVKVDTEKPLPSTSR